jgi:hypothetical protein
MNLFTLIGLAVCGIYVLKWALGSSGSSSTRNITDPTARQEPASPRRRKKREAGRRVFRVNKYGEIFEE